MIELRPIEKQDFINYINLHWKSEFDQLFINIYTSTGGYNQLGTGIGLYNENTLIGFIYYKIDIKKPMWFRKTQECKRDLIPRKYNKLWEYNLLEIHPDFRQKGFGSMLIQEVYNRMPVNYVLIGLSEYTDNHIKFYEKNGFIRNTFYKCSSYHIFFRIKK